MEELIIVSISCSVPTYIGQVKETDILSQKATSITPCQHSPSSLPLLFNKTVTVVELQASLMFEWMPS